MLVISSVGDSQHEWEEVQSNCVCIVDVGARNFETQHCELQKVCNESSVQFKIQHMKAYSKVPIQWSELSQRLLVSLEDSLRKRVTTIPSKSPLEAEFAVLFSGGLDCSVIAALARKIIGSTEKPIDLLNVAFENPRILNYSISENAIETCFDQCPDRISGLRSFKEINQIFPGKWNFVCIDISHSTYLEHRDRIIRLMGPCKTEMDLSLAAAFYFAATGSGKLYQDDSVESLPSEIYHSQAKVLFSGFGADEQLGGYSRHLTVWKRSENDWQAITNVIIAELSRLGSRNLGRDDRMMSCHGKEIKISISG